MRHGRVLRRLRTCFGLLKLRIDVGIITEPIKAETAKLHSGAIDSVIRRHDDSFLLIHDSPLKACCAARRSTRSKPAYREPAGWGPRRRSLRRRRRGRSGNSSARRQLGSGSGASLSVRRGRP